MQSTSKINLKSTQTTKPNVALVQTNNATRRTSAQANIRSYHKSHQDRSMLYLQRWQSCFFGICSVSVTNKIRMVIVAKGQNISLNQSRVEILLTHMRGNAQVPADHLLKNQPRLTKHGSE